MESKSSFFVMDRHLNYANTLFGGELMAAVDLEAAKVARQVVYQVGADNAVTVAFNMNFRRPAVKGDLITLHAELESIGRTSITLKVSCYKINRDNEEFIGEAITKFVIMRHGKPFEHRLKKEERKIVPTECDCMKFRWEVREDGNRYCVNCGANKTNY